MERDAEIDQIDQDLALLHERYASYRRAASVMKAMVVVLMTLAAIAAAFFAVKLFLSDWLYGVFFLGAVLIFIAAATWFVRSMELRWIDFVSQAARGIYNPYFFTPDIEPGRRARSDAELIEWQIADRERRLSELQAGAPGAEPGR